MPTNQYLDTAIDLGTQAKFSYTETPLGYSDGDVLNEVYDSFGIFVTQQSPDVTVDLPTTGLNTATRHYFRQLTSAYASSYSIVVNLDGSNTVTLAPGATLYVFWDGNRWMAFPTLQYESMQGRIETPQIQSYLIIRGGRSTKYLDKIHLNIDSGSGEVGVLKNGTTVTTSNIALVAGTESQYTFSPKVEISEADTVGLNFSKLVNLEGVHYRIDIDSSP